MKLSAMSLQSFNRNKMNLLNKINAENINWLEVAVVVLITPYKIRILLTLFRILRDKNSEKEDQGVMLETQMIVQNLLGSHHKFFKTLMSFKNTKRLQRIEIMTFAAKRRNLEKQIVLVRRFQGTISLEKHTTIT